MVTSLKGVALLTETFGCVAIGQNKRVVLLSSLGVD